MRRIAVLLGVFCIVTAARADVMVSEPVHSDTSLNARVMVNVDDLIKKAVKADDTADLKRVLEKYDAALKKQGVVGCFLYEIAPDATKEQWDMIIKYVKDDSAFACIWPAQKRTLLFASARNPKAGLEITKFLVEEKKLDVNTRDVYGYTAIARHSEGANDDNITAYLIDHGADTEILSVNKGPTALISSCSWGKDSEQHALNLIAHGADVFHEIDFDSPLFSAAYSGQPKAIKAILAAMVQRTPDHEGMTVRYWVDRPLQGESLTKYGPLTALMKAIDSNLVNSDIERGDRIGTIKALIAAGADVNYRWLLVFKDPQRRWNRIGYPGRTPIFLARNGDIVRALVAAGADVNAHDDAGSTPLSVCTGRYIEGINHPYISALDSTLHAHIMDKLLEAVEALLQNHADPFPNPKEPAPYQYAVKSGNQKLINVFRKYHADVVNPYLGFDMFGHLIHTSP